MDHPGPRAVIITIQTTPDPYIVEALVIRANRVIARTTTKDYWFDRRYLETQRKT